MDTTLGGDADEVPKVLASNGFNKKLAKQAVAIAQQQGRFTVFAVVDALTRIARNVTNAGDRSEFDQKAAQLLQLAV